MVVTVVSAGAVGLGLVAARGRGDRQADAQIPDLLEHVARELRSGRGLVAGLGSAGRTVGGIHGHELGAAEARVERGARLVEALHPWVDDHPRPPVRLAVAALEVASEAGGAAARALDGIAASLRVAGRGGRRGPGPGVAGPGLGRGDGRPAGDRGRRSAVPPTRAWPAPSSAPPSG